MGDYRVVTKLAIEMSQGGIAPETAWKKACAEVSMPESSTDKSCPKSAFLGLCEEGKIPGIEKKRYTRSIKNKRYALIGFRLLEEDSKWTENEYKLWLRVMEEDNNDPCKCYNHQMAVVIAAWKVIRNIP